MSNHCHTSHSQICESCEKCIFLNIHDQIYVNSVIMSDTNFHLKEIDD